MCESNLAWYVPPSGNFTFFSMCLVKIPEGNASGIKMLVKTRGKVKLPEGGMYDAQFERNIKIIYFTLKIFFFKFSKSSNSCQNYIFEKKNSNVIWGFFNLVILWT